MYGTVRGEECFALFNEEQTQQVFDAYAAADFFQVPAMRNTVIDNLITNFGKHVHLPSAKNIAMVYDGSAQNARIRKPLLDFAVCLSSREKPVLDEEQREDYPPDFTFELSQKASTGHRRPIKLWNVAKGWNCIEPCSYHDHDGMEVPRSPEDVLQVLRDPSIMNGDSFSKFARTANYMHMDPNHPDPTRKRRPRSQTPTLDDEYAFVLESLTGSDCYTSAKRELIANRTY